MKLQQDQIWKLAEDDFIFIVRLERLEVEYRRIHDLAHKKGPNHTVSKKEFCRLIKPARLLTLEEIRSERETPRTLESSNSQKSA